MHREEQKSVLVSLSVGKKHISLKRKERGREGRIDELKKKEKRQKYKMRCDLHIYVLF